MKKPGEEPDCQFLGRVLVLFYTPGRFHQLSNWILNVLQK
jgi:hypothetical protein